MERRLVKIAKELNVGLSTIVDFLTDKGYEIDNKPTAKVSEDMYNELLKEFAKSLDIKNRADQLVIGTRPSGNKKEEEAASPSGLKELSPKSRVSLTGSKPSISLSPKKEEPKPEEPKKEATPAPAPEPEVEKEVEKPTPEVVAEEKKEPVVEKAPPAEAPKEESEPAAPVAEEKKEPEPERAKAGGLKVLGKIDLDSKDRRTGKAKKKKAAPAPQAEEKAEPEAKKEAPAPAKEPEKPAPVAPKPAEASKDEAPVAKADEGKPKAAEEKPTGAKAPEADSDTSEKPKEGGEEMVRAKTPELRGLKILGKIDTSKLGARGRGTKKDNKTKSDTKSTSSSGDSGERKRRKRKRKKITADTATGNKRGRQGSRAGAGARGKSGQDEPREVSKKEIEDKIKATMARMAGKGKKKRQRIRRDNRERMREKQEARELEGQSDKLEVTEFISVQELANLMDVPAADVIMTCMNLGVIVSINQRLEADVIELVAEEYGHEIEFISVEEELEEEEEYVDDPEDLEPRAPIVTIMGHVDHGKTSLLDYIRSATVADGEAGGITQHIGAYEVNVDGDKAKRVTFLDTPGHEAFTAMRARGAKVTDIAVIIIAADDSIMPQTKEAISHAEAAGVPIIFAINKIDKPGANPEKIKQDLASMNYLVEDWGGAYGSADISAKNGDGVDTLLERILLEAEMKELKANPDRPAIGAILEASLEKGRGYVAKMLIQAGTLRVGDSMVSGEHSGRVKAMFNERNKRVKEAGPSKPVLVLGLGGAPQAGERVKVVDSEQEAREIANRRAQISREQANRATKRISLDEIGRRLALGNFKELNLIVKGDVDGSVEALSDSLIKLSQETVQVNVIHRAVGQIVESDVLLATASDAIIVGFQVRPSSNARKLAEREGVQIKSYSIIYEAIEEIKLAIEGMLDTIKEENVLGSIEVREVFKISKVGTVAGCYVTEGKVARDSHVRLIREGIVIYPTKEGQIGEINALKRFKDDVKEVRAGMECGISVKNYNDIKVGDVIEAYEIVETKQKISV